VLVPIAAPGQSEGVPRKRWSELSPGVRRAVIACATAEGVLKLAALIDLAQRPARQIRGSKAAWAIAITFVNSAGALPVAYFTRGIRR
jgi:hypothetical protein